MEFKRLYVVISNIEVRFRRDKKFYVNFLVVLKKGGSKRLSFFVEIM